ncbi:MAG: CBS domain-containing protein [Solirubrobacteraceae bacterium]|nr:CBS domain-containing protein [Solirubrobacteraceae bacterium]
MLGERSIKLFSVAGIRIGANPSWFLFLFLMIIWLSDYFGDVLVGSTTTVAYVTAVVAAICFFASLLLHELGHALMARRLGIGTSGIDLWLFGGVAKLSRDSETPGEEFKVAIAGPLVTAAIVVLCLAIGAVASNETGVLDAATLTRSSTTPWIALLGWLALTNLVLLVFNMLPAFPLDGGRVTRAIAWKVTGDRSRGTRFSGYLGQIFGWLMVGFGLFIIFATGSIVSGIWSAVLGWFLASAARNAVAGSRYSEQLEGITAGEIMDMTPMAMPATVTVAEAQTEFFGRFPWPWFAVVDELGRLEGIVRSEQVDAAIEAGRGAEPIRAILDPGQAEASAVTRETPVENLLGLEVLRRLGAVMVIDPDHRLCGVVTEDELLRALATSPPQRY